MTDNSQENNWLREEFISCPNCHEQLWRIDHSPMMDDWLLYCERCANRVEVSYYDPLLMKKRSASGTQNQTAFRTEMDFIEEHLKPCNCGGNFQFNAPRRCPYCLTEVIPNEPGVDLWPFYYYVAPDEVDNITEEQENTAMQFEETHIRRDDLWK